MSQSSYAGLVAEATEDLDVSLAAGLTVEGLNTGLYYLGLLQ